MIKSFGFVFIRVIRVIRGEKVFAFVFYAESATRVFESAHCSSAKLAMV